MRDPYRFRWKFESRRRELSVFLYPLVANLCIHQTGSRVKHHRRQKREKKCRVGDLSDLVRNRKPCRLPVSTDSEQQIPIDAGACRPPLYIDVNVQLSKKFNIKLVVHQRRRLSEV